MRFGRGKVVGSERRGDGGMMGELPGRIRRRDVVYEHMGRIGRLRGGGWQLRG